MKYNKITYECRTHSHKARLFVDVGCRYNSYEPLLRWTVRMKQTHSNVSFLDVHVLGRVIFSPALQHANSLMTYTQSSQSLNILPHVICEHWLEDLMQAEKN